MAVRKAITQKVRFEIFKRDSFKCQYCGKSAPDVILNVDHIKPVAEGGSNHNTNLITSCFDCNSGKSDRLLDDNTMLEKQKKQLEELNERRQQLEMMMNWREGLMKLDDDKLKYIAEKWKNGLGDHYHLNEAGLKTARKLIKKYDFNPVMDALEKSISQYIKFDKSGKPTAESAEYAWKMVAKICSVQKNSEEKPYLKQLFYIRGILKNRLSYFIDWKALDLLEKSYLCGASLENLADFAKRVKNWTNFTSELEDFIENNQQKDDDE